MIAADDRPPSHGSRGAPRRAQRNAIGRRERKPFDHGVDAADTRRRVTEPRGECKNEHDCDQPARSGLLVEHHHPTGFVERELPERKVGVSVLIRVDDDAGAGVTAPGGGKAIGDLHHRWDDRGLGNGDVD